MYKSAFFVATILLMPLHERLQYIKNLISIFSSRKQSIYYTPCQSRIQLLNISYKATLKKRNATTYDCHRVPFFISYILSSIIHPFHTEIRFPDISLQSLSRFPRALYPAVCFSDHSPLLSWRTSCIVLLYASQHNHFYYAINCFKLISFFNSASKSVVSLPSDISPEYHYPDSPDAYLLL